MAGKKLRRRFKKILTATLLTCLCINRKKVPLAPSNEHLTSSLQLLLQKNLENQAEDRQCYDQLRQTLTYLTSVLERFALNRPPNEDTSNFTITVSKNSIIQCQADFKSQSLMVVNVPQTHWISSFSQDSLETGYFNRDKAIQSTAHSSTESKLIQTHLFHPDIIQFKLSLISHMRSLKQDVVTLRELLFSVDECSVSEMRRLSNREGHWMREECEYKYFQAKLRASNFMKFYKLRNKNNVKTKRKI